MNKLTVSNLSKAYSYVQNPVIQDINLELVGGKTYAVLGENGSGKSTLLKIIAGLESADAGKVWLNKAVVKGPTEKLIPGHEEICYLKQELDDFGSHSILECFHFVLKKYSPEFKEKRIALLSSLFGLEAHLNKKQRQLSGGEKQRVNLALALAPETKLLILDEPFNHLDFFNKNLLMESLFKLRKLKGLIVVLVSHFPADVLALADEGVVLHKGKATQSGSISSIFENPLNAYCASLLGPTQFFSKTKRNPANEDFFACLSMLGDKSMYFVRTENIQISKHGNFEAFVKSKISDGFVKRYKFALSSDEKIQLQVDSNLDLEAGAAIRLSITKQITLT